MRHLLFLASTLIMGFAMTGCSQQGSDHVEYDPTAELARPPGGKSKDYVNGMDALAKRIADEKARGKDKPGKNKASKNKAGKK